MRNHFKWSMRKENGYTLIEGIIQLSVFILLSQIFAMTIVWLHKIEGDVINPTETDWALFVQDVETYLNDVENIVKQSEGVGVRFQKEGEEYDIELYQNLIRKQKNRLGHEPMLLRVKSLSVTVEGRVLQLSVEFLDGIQKERTFYVTFPSK